MEALREVVGERIVGWGRCWTWFLVALVLLLWVDLGTTLAAADVYGLEAEANPIMRALLESGLAITLLIHALVFGIALTGFSVVVGIGRHLEDPLGQRYRLCCFGWVVMLVFVGIGVAVNNLALVALAFVG